MPQAQASQIVQLDGKDLPARCPSSHMAHWSSHPRVFLELDAHGAATCPYCGTQYQLKPGVAAAH